MDAAKRRNGRYTAAPTMYAKYVGRVGALAVALGVGAAVATTPGVARADETSTSNDAGSESSSKSETDTSDASKDDAPRSVKDVHDAIERRIEKRIERATDRLRKVVNDTAHSSGAAINSTLRLGVRPNRPKPTKVGDADVSQVQRPGVFGANQHSASSSSSTTASQAQEANQSAILKNESQQLSSRPGITSITEDRPVATTLSSVTQRVLESVVVTDRSINSIGESQGLTSLSDEVESAGRQGVADPVRTPLNAVTRVLSAALAPFLGASNPNQPAPPNPVLLGVLAWVRRQIEETPFGRAVLNQSPEITTSDVGVVDNGNGTFTITPTGSDPDGDDLTYTAVASGANEGTLVKNADGTFTYTVSNPGTWDKSDTVTVTVSDAAGGAHLHGLAGLFGAGGHTDSVQVVIAPDEEEGPAAYGDGTITGVEIEGIAARNLDEAALLDGKTFRTANGAEVTYHFDPATNKLTADVNPNDANRLFGFLSPPQDPSGLAALGMRMMAFAALAAPNYDGVERFDVEVGDQIIQVEVPISAARLQLGAPVTVGGAPNVMVGSGDYLYVVNQQPQLDEQTGERFNTVSVIDTRTNQVVDTVQVGYGATSAVAVGGRVYVTSQDQTVTVIDSATNTEVDVDPGDGEGDVDRILLDHAPSGSPQSIAASSDGKRLYVANQNGSISVIDTTTNMLVDTKPPSTTDETDPEADIDALEIAGLTTPGAIAVSGDRLYVTDQVTRSLLVVDITTGPSYGTRVGAPIVLPATPNTIAVVRTPGAEADEVFVLLPQNNSIVVVDPVSGQVADTIALTSPAYNMVVSPDGSLAYLGTVDSVTVIDTAARKVVLTTKSDSTPDNIFNPVGLSADGSRVYAADYIASTQPFTFGTTVQAISFVTGGNAAAPTATAVTGDVDPKTGAVKTVLTAADADNDALSIATTQPANGTAKVNANLDGTYTVTYTPNGQARLDAFDTAGVQEDSFIVTITDGNKVTSVPVTVPIDPADAAVTETLPSQGSFDFTRGLTIAPNGDVYLTALSASFGSAPHTVKLYNASTQTLTAEVRPEERFSTNQLAEDVAVDPAGNVYVTDPTTGVVKVFDANGTSSTVDVQGTPVGVFTDSDGNVYAIVGKQIAIPNQEFPDYPSYQTQVTVFDVTNNRVVGNAHIAPYNEFGEGRDNLTDGAVDDDGRAYVTNPLHTSVSVIDPANPGREPIDVGGTPISVAYSEASDRVFVTVVRPADGIPDSYTVSVVDISSGSAVDVGGPVYTVQPSATNPGDPESFAALSDMAVSPDGTEIYVTNYLDSSVIVIDADSGAVTRTIAIPSDPLFGTGNPVRVAIAPDGEHVYVADSRGNVSVISFAASATNL